MIKSVVATIVLFFSLGISSAFAKIWRVNNNSPAVPADFTSLQAAHNGAASGDTLHLEGSPDHYGTLNCSKKLVIIGTGYFIAENPNTQATTQPAKTASIFFNNGSAGSVVMGLELLDNILVYTNDITIKRNKFSIPGNGNPDYYIYGIYLRGTNNIPAKNIIIAQNYGLLIQVEWASTGVFIFNNYIGVNSWYGESTTASCLGVNINARVVAQNNIFRRGKISADNSAFSNNIMVAGFFEGTGNLVSNNIATGTQFGTANANQANVSVASLFVGAGTGISTDGQWKLKAGSPAIGAGSGSTTQTPVDIGMYGGQAPYVLSGLPPVPAIYYLDNTPVGSNVNPIKVTVKVRSVN